MNTSPSIRDQLFSGQRLEKKMNEYVILNLIRKHAAIGIPDLVRMSQLSRPTVDTIVNSLEKKELIKKEGFGNPQGGRKPNLWRLNNIAGFILGIDVETPHVNIVLTDLELNVISSSETYFSLRHTCEEILIFLKGKIYDILKRAGIEAAQLVGIGIGVPGIIDKAQGISVSIERLPDWKDIPLVRVLTKEFDVPVFLENDVTLMAIAEKTLNEEMKNIENLLYIGFRTGIGAGIFINGEPYNGVYGNAGFIGHSIVMKDGPQCLCGNKGCLELFVDEPAIIERMREICRRSENPDMALPFENNPETISLESIMQAASAGDQCAEKLLQDAASYLSIGIGNAVNLLDIPTIIIGGSITKAGELFLNLVTQESNSRVQALYRDHLDIRFAVINDNPAALGAAVVVLKDLFKDPYTETMAAL